MYLWLVAVAIVIQVGTCVDEIKFPTARTNQQLRKYPGWSNESCHCLANVCNCCINYEHLPPPGKVCIRLIFNYGSMGSFHQEENIFTNLVINENGSDLHRVKDFINDANPICLPLAAPGVEFCAKFYGVQLDGKKGRVCVRLMPRILGVDVITIDLECINFYNGVLTLGPLKN